MKFPNRNSLSVAVLGVGYMGESHVRIFSSTPGVNLVAICEIDKEVREKIGKQYKIKSYSNYKKLLTSEKLDAVAICLPTELHYQAASLAIRQKIPVFIEKPIAAKVWQAKKIIQLAKTAKIPVMVGHIERFNPVVEEIRTRIKSGELGKIFKIHAQRFSPPPVNSQGVSAAVDLATHDLDIIQYLVGGKPVRIYSESDTKLHKKPDLITALIRFQNGLVGIVEVSWLYPAKIRNLQVLGEKGMYVANYLTQELFFYRQNLSLFKSQNFLNYPTTKTDLVKIAFETREPLEAELEAFIQALRVKSRMPVTAQDGLKVLEMAVKIEKTGRARVS